jgi:hypothetical protein
LRFVAVGPGAEFFERCGVAAGEKSGLVVHVGFAVEDAGGFEPGPAGKGGPAADLGIVSLILG